ncbi:MFS transporter, partial [Candidatus Bathyarchaeota archaeon]|nr:MFS transporter [Candidatus Bathyarchaeota archaeon]
MTSVAGTGRGENTAGESPSTIVKDERVTCDFSGMVSIIRYNSVGFFFTDFVIPYASGDILDASGVSVGGLFSLLIVGSVISAMLAGFLSDRLPSRKKLVFMGATGRGISYLIMYVAIITKSLIFMNVGTFVLGLHAAIYWVPMDALISDKSSKHHRSYAFG